MIATALVVNHRRAVKLAHAIHDRFLQHAFSIQIFDQRGQSRVKRGKQVIPKLSEVLTRLDVIAARAEKIDETAIRKFLQDEGIKIHVRAY